MQLVLARPYDDKDIIESYIVTHDNPGKNFETDWESCLDKAKEKDPDEWTITDVIKRMESKGWQILRTDHVVVTY